MYSSVEVNWLIHTVPKTVTRFVEKNNLSFMAKIIALTNKVIHLPIMQMGQMK